MLGVEGVCEQWNNGVIQEGWRMVLLFHCFIARDLVTGDIMSRLQNWRGGDEPPSGDGLQAAKILQMSFREAESLSREDATVRKGIPFGNDIE